MSKQKRKFSFRTILSLVTAVLVAFVVIENWTDIKEAIGHLAETNIFVLLLLIPEQLFMYYCCGQIFFSYMLAKKNTKKISSFNLMRISLELNFVNHAVPAGGFGGLGYIGWRLKDLGVTPGQTSFMYALRYVITICANQFQTILAIVALLILGGVPASGTWVIWVTATLSIGIMTAVAAVISIASSEKRIHWFANISTRFVNWCAKVVTLDRKKNFFSREVVDKYFCDIHDDLMTARANKRLLVKPICWGIIYSFFEIATYWIVSISLGHPELLPQIMIGEAIGSITGAIVPYGLYEIGMAGIMMQLGVETYLAGTIAVLTRVIVLASTIISGYGFYQHAISKLGKERPTEHE